ncbi:MAG: hypothetical protein RBT63_03475 [Bdellovibrionales bacterium]|jgi:hypothetical protein|nr:hypothetical protein [Bdellovibrionales bacterium]
MRSFFSDHLKAFALLVIKLALATTFAPSTEAVGAACCGGGFAVPSLIVGDEKAIFSSEFSFANVTTEVSSQGIWQNRTTPESLYSVKLQGAHIFKDRFQIGGSIPVLQRARGHESSSGLGDIGLNFGYEILPEWSYSSWRPRGAAFLSLTIPTGRSIQEADAAYLLDARGRGFWALGIGASFTKVFSTRSFGQWDTVATLEGHRSFPKDVRNQTLQGTLHPGWGASLAAGIGYNLGEARIGAMLTNIYEDAVRTTGSISSDGALARYVTAAITASYMLDDEWAVSLTASDQTLLGAPTNTSLSKGVAFSLQRKISR